jgi:predicted permease
LRASLEAAPGVESVALSEEGLITNSESDGTISFPDHPKLTPHPHTFVFVCSDSFLSAVRIPILRGRDLSHADGPNAPQVAVINESFRRQYFPDEDPIGKIFYHGSPPYKPEQKPIEIVGVARDAHYYSVRETPAPTIYVDYRQDSKYLGQVVFAIRSALPTGALAATVRRSAAAIDPTIPIVNMLTQEEQIRLTLNSERLFASLVSMFGLLAALLAAIGLYGVLAYSVSRRTAEIGIRIALGASRGNVLWHMVRGSLLTVLAGLAAGVPAALALTKVTSSLLFGVKPDDLLTLVAACLVMLIVSAISAWIPARRATRIQPTQALRYE